MQIHTHTRTRNHAQDHAPHMHIHVYVYVHTNGHAAQLLSMSGIAREGDRHTVHEEEGEKQRDRGKGRAGVGREGACMHAYTAEHRERGCHGGHV